MPPRREPEIRSPSGPEPCTIFITPISPCALPLVESQLVIWSSHSLGQSSSARCVGKCRKSGHVAAITDYQIHTSRQWGLIVLPKWVDYWGRDGKVFLPSCYFYPRPLSLSDLSDKKWHKCCRFYQMTIKGCLHVLATSVSQTGQFLHGSQDFKKSLYFNCVNLPVHKSRLFSFS